MTRAALLVVDVQATFAPPLWLVRDIRALASRMLSVATVEHYDEARVPFRAQLDWTPGSADESLVPVQRSFVKYGYNPPSALLVYLAEQGIERVFVCGIQADTCVLAAGFVLFDAGLYPTLVSDLVVGSSLDPSGELGIRLWRHHFGAVTTVDQLVRQVL